jgi:hypothetical protein
MLQAAATVSPQATPEQDVMEWRARLFAIALGIAVLLFVVNLVRTRKLKEEFALLWLLTAVVLVLAPLLIDYLDMIAHALGIEYPPAFIFVLAIICVLLVLFQFSMRISHFSEQIKVLTQELALLRARLEFLERSPPPRDTESRVRSGEAESRHLSGEAESRHLSGEANGSATNEPARPARRDARGLAKSARRGSGLAKGARRSSGLAKSARRSSGLAKSARRSSGLATDEEGIDVNSDNDAQT